jgi:hypothetical protein
MVTFIVFVSNILIIVGALEVAFDSIKHVYHSPVTRNASQLITGVIDKVQVQQSDDIVCAQCGISNDSICR